jgi:alpha-L-fucosidase 2
VPALVWGIDPQYQLWYGKSAMNWEEALPVGNGRLGAMVYGNATEEIIQLNEDSLYTGKPQDATHSEFYDALQDVEKLLADNEYEEAHVLAEQKLVCKGRGSHHCTTANCDYGTYQTLGDLALTFYHRGEVCQYQRKLDVRDAIVTVEYEVDGIKYQREVFASYPEQVIAVRLTADKAHQLNLDVALKREENASISIKGSSIRMQGNVYPGGIDYGVTVALVASGGSLKFSADRVNIRDADEVLLYVAASTTFREKDPCQANERTLRTARTHSYQALKERHLEDYQKLFNRCRLELPTSFTSHKPTLLRLWALREGAFDPSVYALYFNYGRYLLISSSRSPFLPANLQGIWSNSLFTPWCGDFHLNINVQMNYWPAETTNLTECSDPLDAFIFYLERFGQRTAEKMYHARGWVAHHISNIWGFTEPAENPRWGLFPGGSAWLCRHLWDKYLFHPESEYLEKIYPTLKGASLFYLDTLYRDPHSQYLLPCPSNSPENQYVLPSGKLGYLSRAATVQLSLIRDIFNSVIRSSRILNVDTSYAMQLEDIVQQLYPYQIDVKGLLKEYAEDFPLPMPGHRHMSHLYALYPAYDRLIIDSPELMEAAKESLNQRWKNGFGQTGWNLGWTINLFARLGDKQSAYQALRQMLTCSTLPNLFDNHPPFQIDGNFGGIAGIAEMLLQSHTGEIVLLPALPDSWKEGSITKLRARGGLDVSMQWHNSQLTALDLLATASNTFAIRFPDTHALTQLLVNGAPIPWEDTTALNISLQNGDVVTVR